MTTGSSPLTWTLRCCWRQPWKVSRSLSSYFKVRIRSMSPNAFNTFPIIAFHSSSYLQRPQCQGYMYFFLMQFFLLLFFFSFRSKFSESGEGFKRHRGSVSKGPTFQQRSWSHLLHHRAGAGSTLLHSSPHSLTGSLSIQPPLLSTLISLIETKGI